jgi:hypothetical protein
MTEAKTSSNGKKCSLDMCELLLLLYVFKEWFVRERLCGRKGEDISHIKEDDGRERERAELLTHIKRKQKNLLISHRFNV